MFTDPISDLLTRMRNAVGARHTNTKIPYSLLKESILKILKEKGYIRGMEVIREGKYPELVVEFNENSDRMTMRKISKPGQRIYRKYEQLRRVNNGYGMSIVSTSKGIMTGDEARKQKLGGELLCEIY
jgi:small subunit ribosomal protein S8